MSTVTGKTSVQATLDNVRWRLGRILLLVATLGVILYLDAAGVPGSSPAFPFLVTHPFTLLYMFMAFALWLGDAWESAGAIVASWIGSYLLVTATSRWYGYAPPHTDTADWLVYVATSLALFGLVTSLRRKNAGVRQAPVPAISSSMENPVLIIHGRAQLLQGTAVMFDTADNAHIAEVAARVQGVAQPAPKRARLEQ